MPALESWYPCTATTTQRMMDNGIGMDMISLSRPPLHTAPLFVSKTDIPVERAPASGLEAATAAGAAAKEHEQFQSQHRPGDSPVPTTRRSSTNSEETITQGKLKYEASLLVSFGLSVVPTFQ